MCCRNPSFISSEGLLAVYWGCNNLCTVLTYWRYANVTVWYLCINVSYVQLNLYPKGTVKVARYSYHKNPAQESRTQNRVTIFTRRSRKLINKMKELPKWPDVSSCSRHITPLRVFYSVLCQLLTSLEFSILEKQCAISLYFVWWPMFKFCMLYCTAKNFHYTKNKKIL
jgi:hypothetical protein